MVIIVEISYFKLFVKAPIIQIDSYLLYKIAFLNDEGKASDYYHIEWHVNVFPIQLITSYSWVGLWNSLSFP